MPALVSVLLTKQWPVQLLRLGDYKLARTSLSEQQPEKMYFILHSWGDDHPHFHTNRSLAFLYSCVYHIHTIILKQNYYLALKSEDKHTPAMQRESSTAHTGQRLQRRWAEQAWVMVWLVSLGGDKALSGGTCKQNHEWVWETGLSTVGCLARLRCQPGAGHAAEAWSVRVGCSVFYSWARHGLLPALGEKQKTSVRDMCPQQSLGGETLIIHGQVKYWWESGPVLLSILSSSKDGDLMEMGVLLMTVHVVQLPSPSVAELSLWGHLSPSSRKSRLITHLSCFLSLIVFFWIPFFVLVEHILLE